VAYCLVMAARTADWNLRVNVQVLQRRVCPHPHPHPVQVPRPSRRVSVRRTRLPCAERCRLCAGHLLVAGIVAGRPDPPVLGVSCCAPYLRWFLAEVVSAITQGPLQKDVPGKLAGMPARRWRKTVRHSFISRRGSLPRRVLGTSPPSQRRSRPHSAHRTGRSGRHAPYQRPPQPPPARQTTGQSRPGAGRPHPGLAAPVLRLAAGRGPVLASCDVMRGFACAAGRPCAGRGAGGARPARRAALPGTRRGAAGQGAAARRVPASRAVVWTVPASVDTRLSCPIRRESEKWVRHAAHLRRSTRSSR
jgi:hypothetical protein